MRKSIVSSVSSWASTCGWPVVKLRMGSGRGAGLCTVSVSPICSLGTTTGLYAFLNQVLQAVFHRGIMNFIAVMEEFILRIHRAYNNNYKCITLLYCYNYQEVT